MPMIAVVQELKTVLHTKFNDANYVKALNHHQVLVDNRVILDFDPDTGSITYIPTDGERFSRTSKKRREKKYYDLKDKDTSEKHSKRTKGNGERRCARDWREEDWFC